MRAALQAAVWLDPRVSKRMIHPASEFLRAGGMLITGAAFS